MIIKLYVQSEICLGHSERLDVYPSMNANIDICIQLFILFDFVIIVNFESCYFQFVSIHGYSWILHQRKSMIIVVINEYIYIYIHYLLLEKYVRGINRDGIDTVSAGRGTRRE